MTRDTPDSPAGQASQQSETGGDGSQEPKEPTDSKLKPQENVTKKRRRVMRACDECRRKKIKCNGRQPCENCTIYNDSSRKQRPAPCPADAVGAGCPCSGN